MIIFGTVSAHPEKLATQCAPGIAWSMSGEGYEHKVLKSDGREIFSGYDSLLRHAAIVFGESARADDALVLLHDDLELRDTSLSVKVARVMSDPDIAVVGLIGSTGARTLAWWEGTQYGRVTDDAYGLHDFGGFGSSVDSLDGMLLIVSPWACRRLWLTKLGYHGFHGYADELCRQAQGLGKRAVVADITAHHHSRGGYAGGVETWDAANKNFRKRWLT